jgi:hypothetical protein
MVSFVKRRKVKRKMDDFEFEIEWIPEESSKPYEIDMANVVIDTPSHIVDKLCKKKYGHTNWARMGVMSPEQLIGNPHEFDYEEGVIYFKNALLV